jgi:hypothetical protein
MPDWIDFTPDLGNHSFCTRIWLWPCQCGLALSNALLNCDVNGCCTVLWCCPCRTFCGWCPTASETSAASEPETMPYRAIPQEDEEDQRQPRPPKKHPLHLKPSVH